MADESFKGEILRNALRLVHIRGDGALDYAQKMAEQMEEEGDERDHEFWEKIARQVELLIDQEG